MSNFETATTPSVNRFDVPVKFGIVLGILSVLIQYVSYSILLPKSFMGYIGGMVAIFIITVALWVVTGVQQRKAMGGFISFKDAFQAIFVAIVISSLIATVWSVVYVKYINPDLADNFKSSMLDMMETYKVPQEKLEETSSKMDVSKFRDISFGAQAMALAIRIIAKSVVGLIIAAIVKKEPKTQMV